MHSSFIHFLIHSYIFATCVQLSEVGPLRGGEDGEQDVVEHISGGGGEVCLH